MKRTELRRKTPMKRGGLTAPTIPVNPPATTNDPVLAKHRPHRGLKQIPLKTRRAVHERDVNCVAGGCPDAHHVHHRKLRSQAGDNSLTNLILLCAKHHDAIHGNPQLAYELGYLVRSWDDPGMVEIVALWPEQGAA